MGIERQNETVTQVLEQLRAQGKLPPPPVSRREELAERLMNDILEWIERHNPSGAELTYHALQSESIGILTHVLASELAVQELNPYWTEIINREPTEENAWRFKEALDCRQRAIAGRLTEMLFALAMWRTPQAKPNTGKEKRP